MRIGVFEPHGWRHGCVIKNPFFSNFYRVPEKMNFQVSQSKPSQTTRQRAGKYFQSNVMGPLYGSEYHVVCVLATHSYNMLACYSAVYNLAFLYMDQIFMYSIDEIHRERMKLLIWMNVCNIVSQFYYHHTQVFVISMLVVDVALWRI